MHPDQPSQNPDLAPKSIPASESEARSDRHTNETVIRKLKDAIVHEHQRCLTLTQLEEFQSELPLLHEDEGEHDGVQFLNPKLAITGIEVIGLYHGDARRLENGMKLFLKGLATRKHRIELLAKLGCDASGCFRLGFWAMGRGSSSLAKQRCLSSAKFVHGLLSTCLPELAIEVCPAFHSFSDETVLTELEFNNSSERSQTTASMDEQGCEAIYECLHQHPKNSILLHFVNGAIDEITQRLSTGFFARLFVANPAEQPLLLPDLVQCTLLGQATAVLQSRTASEELFQSLAADTRASHLAPAQLLQCLPLRPAGAISPGFSWRPSARTFVQSPDGQDAPYGLIGRAKSKTLLRSRKRSRCTHLFVSGKTGCGKSSLLLNRCLHDIRAGRGVCVIETHGPLVDDILCRMPPERAADVILLDPGELEAPVGFNPLVVPEATKLPWRRERDRIISDLLLDVEHAYREQWAHISGPVCETYMRSGLACLMGVNRPAASETPHLGFLRSFFLNADFRNRLRAQLLGQEPLLDDFLSEAEAATRDLNLRDVSGYVTSRFTRFLSDAGMASMICQRRSVDLEQVIAERRIVLCHLRRAELGEHSGRLLASMLFSRLRRAAMSASRVDAEPFCVYADECQLFADDRVASLLNEGRKFGISMTLATQHLANLLPQVASSILGNVSAFALFRQSPEDASRLCSSVHGLSQRELIEQPNFHAVIVDNDLSQSQPLGVWLPSPEPVINPRQEVLIRQLCRKLWGTPIAQVDSELFETREQLLSN